MSIEKILSTNGVAAAQVDPNRSANLEAAVPADERARMKKAAEEFESVFVSQMLKHAGFDSAFGSEAQSFSQFLLDEIGGEMATGMDLGFAEKAYEHMLARYDAKDVADD